MALKQATKDKLKTTYGLDVEALIAAITATEEKDIELPEDVTVLKAEDLQARDQNKLDEGKKLGREEGKESGVEYAAKKFRQKFGLEDGIGKDIDKVVDAVNTKLNKGDAALQEQVQALLKDKEQLQGKVIEVEGKAKAASFDTSLISMFPANRTSDLTDAEKLALLKMNIEFAEDNGKTVAKRNGQVVTDKTTHAPLPINQVISDLFTEKKWVAAAAGSGGRGGGDNTGGAAGGAGIKTASKFKEKWVVENPGKTEISPEYIDALNKHAKEIQDFDMYN